MKPLLIAIILAVVGCEARIKISTQPTNNVFQSNTFLDIYRGDTNEWFQFAFISTDSGELKVPAIPWTNSYPVTGIVWEASDGTRWVPTWKKESD